MKWMVCPVGAIQANCYLLIDEASNQSLIIDPGGEFEKIETIITKEQLSPLAILLTHAHFDHIGALDQVRDTWNIPAYLHESEATWLNDPSKNGSAFFPMISPVHARQAEFLISDKDKGHLSIGPFSCEFRHTPGHSPGGVSYYFEKERTLFCGDTLFQGSIGRTDQYGGDTEQLLMSIDRQVLTLPDETVVCPGHGSVTTIGKEEGSNPFLI
ncbi:MBL fold metallo-hydrolase [Sporolactobacillus kofuensis]|uniref:MBL fold metallo-hydrolase n=1 Tax=Sporolactobacillus kofuensis TaxID=269672 RepID=A0ABW1WIY2_9BACL|nr:MBL fold metallo-hydrolase [Sporolactobacillus kofuensis]MCO7176513.1 MBL fold metallo-hydrolase [Sporolactobacillus kofuensis]